eukprot:scaffold62692_cov94-Phaeocystis_antarctica.AAC.1
MLSHLVWLWLAPRPAPPARRRETAAHLMLSHPRRLQLAPRPALPDLRREAAVPAQPDLRRKAAAYSTLSHHVPAAGVQASTARPETGGCSVIEAEPPLRRGPHYAAPVASQASAARPTVVGCAVGRTTRLLWPPRPQRSPPYGGRLRRGPHYAATVASKASAARLTVVGCAVGRTTRLLWPPRPAQPALRRPPYGGRLRRGTHYAAPVASQASAARPEAVGCDVVIARPHYAAPVAFQTSAARPKAVGCSVLHAALH